MWTDDYARKLNTKVVLTIVESLLHKRKEWYDVKNEFIVAFEFPVCVFLENAVEIFFEEFARSARAVCEQSGRTLGNWFDVDFTLEKLFGKQLDVSDLLELVRIVDVEKYPPHKRKRIPSNPLASGEEDADSDIVPRERWMPSLPPRYTFRSHQVYYPTHIHRLEDERQSFLERKLQVEELLLSEENWTKHDLSTVWLVTMNVLPIFNKPAENNNEEDEKELLEFLFEENFKEEPVATENIKAVRQMAIQRFERIMNEVDSFGE